MRTFIVLFSILLWGPVAFSITCSERVGGPEPLPPAQILARALSRMAGNARGNSKQASLKDILVEGRKILASPERDAETEVLGRMERVLMQALHDKSENVRWTAAYVLTALRDPTLPVTPERESLMALRTPDLDRRIKIEIDEVLRESNATPLINITVRPMSRGSKGERPFHLQVEVTSALPIDLASDPPMTPVPSSPEPLAATAEIILVKSEAGTETVLLHQEMNSTDRLPLMAWFDDEVVLEKIGVYDQIKVIVRSNLLQTVEQTFEVLQLSQR